MSYGYRVPYCDRKLPIILSIPDGGPRLPRQRVHFCCACKFHLVMKKGQMCETCKKQTRAIASQTEAQ